MKTRDGFVSNSSSSSFVVMTTLENHKAAVAKLGPYGQAVLKAMEATDAGFCQKSTFLGRDCISFMTLSVMDSGPFDYLEVDYEKDECDGCDEDCEEEDAECDGCAGECEECSEGEDEGGARDAFDKYVALIKKIAPGDVFTHGTDG